MVLVLASVLISTTVAKPNIVMMVADDWGFSDLGAFGGMCARGMLAHAHVCSR